MAECSLDSSLGVDGYLWIAGKAAELGAGRITIETPVMVHIGPIARIHTPATNSHWVKADPERV
jgi:hypothetical protein